MIKTVIFVSLVLGVALAAPNRSPAPNVFELPSNASLVNALRVRRDSTPDNFELPSNASVVVGGTIRHGFQCAGRQFGYYADQDNNCQIFHVCMPYEDAEGAAQLRMWSFLCGVGTIFDQAQLVCNYPENSLPCSEAQNLYNINDYFHREDIEFRSGLNGIF